MSKKRCYGWDSRIYVYVQSIHRNRRGEKTRCFTVYGVPLGEVYNQIKETLSAKFGEVKIGGIE